MLWIWKPFLKRKLWLILWVAKSLKRRNYIKCVSTWKWILVKILAWKFNANGLFIWLLLTSPCKPGGSKFQAMPMNLAGVWWCCNLQTEFSVVARRYFLLSPTSSSGPLPAFRAYFKAFWYPFFLTLFPVKRHFIKRVAKTKD